MSGFGYTVTKMQGGSEEDAMQSAILFGMLEISGGLHDTISKKEAISKDTQAQLQQKYGTTDLKVIADRATGELMDMVGGDRKAFQSMMMRYQDIRETALHQKDGAIPGFFDTPSGKKLFEIYTTPKEKLTKEQIKESYSLMSKSIEEVKSGKVERANEKVGMFQEKVTEAKINPNSFFRSPEFKEYYTKGTEISSQKMGGDIVVDQNGAIISGFGKAKEALDTKARTVDVKQMERIENTEPKVQAQEKSAPKQDNQEAIDQTKLENFEGYSDITTKTLDKIEGKKVVSRQFIENSLKEQGMKEQERAIVEEVLKEYEGKKTIPAKEFAEKVHERLMPIEIKEVDPKWEDYQLSEDGYAPGSEEGYVELIHEAPIETDGSGHYGDESKYFGHSRIQIRDINGYKIAVVNEVQSDFMQGEKYKEKLAKNAVGAKQRISDNEMNIQNLKDNIERDKKFIENNPDLPQERIDSMMERAETNKKRIEMMERDRKILEEDVKNKEEEDKKILGSKEYKMIDSYRTTWSDRMIRDEIKWAKDKGMDGIMFPDGKTVAFVERWNGADGVSESAEVGDTVEVHGENVMVLENANGQAKVVAESAIMQDLRHEELLDDMITGEEEMLRSDWEYERENYADKFAEKAQESEKYQEFVDSVKNESDIDEVEMMEKFLEFDENEYQIIRDKVIEEVVDERASEWRRPEDMAEYMRQNYGDNVEVYYPLAWGGGREPHILKIDEGGYVDYIDSKGDHADKKKSLEELQEDWSESQKGTSFFYEKIVPKVLEKQRKDMYKWEDPDTGLEFYRVDFNENDQPGQPIYAYQKMEQAKKKAQITQEVAEATIRKYFTPEEVNVNFVNYISTPEGFMAFGRYRNGAIDLVKNPDSSTPTHESLHAYFDMFTAPGRKAELLEQVKSEQGMKDNIQAEEWLADNFAEYVKGKTRETL